MYVWIIDDTHNPKLLHVYILRGRKFNIYHGKETETRSQEDSTTQKMSYTAFLIITTDWRNGAQYSVPKWVQNLPTLFHSSEL
jgi:hypothetical protein